MCINNLQVQHSHSPKDLNRILLKSPVSSTPGLSHKPAASQGYRSAAGESSRMALGRTGFDLLIPCTPGTCRPLVCHRVGKSAHPICPASTAPYHHKGCKSWPKHLRMPPEILVPEVVVGLGMSFSHRTLKFDSNGFYFF